VVTSGGQAVFAVVAKDSASKTLKGVGKSFGTLKRNGINALKGIAGASVAAAGALAAFTGTAIKGAIDDERSNILLASALKARGFELDKILPKIEEQIDAARRLGQSDDEVRAGLEVGSRYFKNQEKLLKANALAATISSVTGEDMATVMGKIGKAANGQTRGLAALIGPIQKGAKFTDIYRQGNEKFAGVAEALAESTSGKLLTAQEEFNEAMDDFGTKFLPEVNKVLRFVTEKAFPAFQGILETIAPIVKDFFENYITPLAGSIGELFKVLNNADFSIIEVILAPAKVFFEALKIAIDAIVAGIKFIQGTPGQKLAFAAASASAGRGTTFGLGATTGGGGPMTGGTSSYLQTSVQFNVGTQKQDQIVEGALNRAGYERRYP
jgi:hypothetical protein